MKKKYFVAGIISLFIVLSIFQAFRFSSHEYTARKTVENYMDAVKGGKEVDDYIDYDVEGFSNVFEYDYLNTLNEEEKKFIRSYDRDFWEQLYKDKYQTYEEYKKYEKELMTSIHDNAEILVDDDYSFSYWDGESYTKEFEFVYDVTITNSEGQKIYKKATFIVEQYVPHKKDYKIKGIYLN